ncbi:Acetyltransferase, GNAT family [hydrothermal vent metagenome]|uniref:Acetyltransferase, GNAT family n=1 Tax=hydrothermal vent metagenome TaxID=652676 RepID=A0A3B1D051_9ZZZZ
MSDTKNRQTDELNGIFRPALLKDAKTIQALVMVYADQKLMLPRSLNEIYETIRHYTLYEEGGEILGVCGLSILWEDLAEVRALSVKPGHTGKGIGRQLALKAIDEAKRLGAPKVLTLTYVPDFFTKLGFTVVDKNELPHKIWGDCVRCHKFPDCDETSMIFHIG